MKLVEGHLRLAASDITTFAACTHATGLGVAVATGQRPRPQYYPDPSAELLKRRGLEHETAYLATLRVSRSVAEIVPHALDAAEHTLDAMKRGIEVIYQGTLRHGARWLGMPDFLRRVEVPSSLGRWSYEAADAKLARSAKAGALLQLCFYSELLLRAQGVLPKRMTLVLGDGHEESFATARYAAYFRRVRAAFEQALESPPATYPEPVEHCGVCDYAGECDARRRTDDHLSLVAGITTSQRRALALGAVSTVRALATLPLVQPPAVEGIGSAALTRIREQARIQVEGRDAGALRYELLDEREPGRGLGMLPKPSPGDLFLDLEGDPYVLGDGLEYLFGVVEPPATPDADPIYTGLWAFDRKGERAGFERLVARIVERRARHPEMHVYHYNHYEPTALKRLAGRYATCVDELDVLLRGGVFVDLYRAVRQGLRASVESYSIKRLEPLFGFTRTVPLRDANRCLAAFEAWMELRETDSPADSVRDTIEGYNRDDCLSALRLRDWLEGQRLEFERRGVTLARPPLVTGEASEEMAEQVGRVRAASRALLEGVPEDPEARSADDSARYVLAHLLEWHRREDKSAHWEYFRLCELTDDELQEDGAALGGLTYEGVVGQEKQSLVHRYRFPPQDHAIDRARDIDDPRTKKAAGTLVRIDDEAGVLELKRGARSTAPHPTALIPAGPIGDKEQRESLLRLGEHVVAHGLAPTPPIRDGHRAPASTQPPSAMTNEATGATPAERAIPRALSLDGSVLPVQGPPGTGKTHLGAEMIDALLRAGKRVGIVANSHKVITHLLDEACKLVRATGTRLRAIQKSEDGDASRDPFVQVVKTNAEVVSAVTSGASQRRRRDGVAMVAAGHGGGGRRPLRGRGGPDVARQRARLRPGREGTRPPR